MKNQKLFRQLQSLTTERRNPKTMGIDLASVNDTLRLINGEDRKIASVVAREIPSIAQAVRYVVRSFKDGGRLIYVGAGTSGRLGILDASECPPTFGSKPSMVQGLIAGGRKAVFQSQEGSEDLEKEGAREIRGKKISAKDTVCGIAASMRTPYVIGALVEAKRRGARTIIVTTNPRRKLSLSAFSRLRKSVDVAICPEVGPEVIMGSTRMKSGTAQKLILNMITTTSMIQLGKVYENMMVDLRMTSKKLEERAKKVLMIATGVSYDRAASALKDAGGHVKSAIVMLEGNVSISQAKKRLKKSNGFVRPAIAITNRKKSS
jgi:N-acetylmuramic acid 6-phosphate etherase